MSEAPEPGHELGGAVDCSSWARATASSAAGSGKWRRATYW